MKFIIRLFLYLSILQTSYVRAEIWDGVSSTQTPRQAIDRLRKLAQKASRLERQQLSLLAMKAADEMIQKPLPGMELDAIILHQINHLAEQILIDFEKYQQQEESNVVVRELQETLEKATPEDQELLIELAKTFEFIERPLPGLELDVLRSIDNALSAYLILEQFKRIKVFKKVDEKNAQLATSLESNVPNFYPNSPLAYQKTNPHLYPKTVHQLIVQFMLKSEILANPQYLDTPIGKERYEKLRLLFLQRQPTTPALPAEIFEVMHKDWPELHFDRKRTSRSKIKNLPNLDNYMSILAKETATSLQLAYKAMRSGQSEKVQEYVNRAEIFVASAYLAAGNHRGDAMAFHERKLKLSSYFLAGGISTIAIFNSLHMTSVMPNLYQAAGGITLFSIALYIHSLIEKHSFLDLKKSPLLKPTDRKVKEFQKTRMQSWLPKFIRNELDHELSQKSISTFWTQLQNLLPANQLKIIETYEPRNFETSFVDFFQIPRPSLNQNTAQKIQDAQNTAVDWFYQILTTISQCNFFPS